MGKAPKVALGICVRLQKNFHLISKQTKFRNFDPCCFEAIRIEKYLNGSPVSVVDVIKLFWRKSRSPKIKKLKKFVLVSEPALKCENNAIFKQNGLLLLIQLRGNSRVTRVSPKKFYNINYWSQC